MTKPMPPEDPFGIVPQLPVEVAGRRPGIAFGFPVEILSLPTRSQRHGVPGATRATFQRNRADRIIEAEATWRAPGMAMTGNRFPFASPQAILWSTERRREPSLRMLEVGMAMEDRGGATSIVNSIGAAGSIARSHIHLIGGTSEFLRSLPKSTIDPSTVELTDEQLGDECELLRLDPPFPSIAVGIRGPAGPRARAMHHLLECRMTQAFNLIGCDQILWLVPRSPTEIPDPHFPQALGGAEIAGLWCCNDHATFERLATQDMEEAIRIGCVPW